MIEFHIPNPIFGHGTYKLQNRSIPVQFSGSYNSYTSDPATIKIWSEDDDTYKIFESSFSHPPIGWIEGKTEAGCPILFREIQSTRLVGTNCLEGEARHFYQGDVYTIVDPGETIEIHVRTSNSPLIIPEWHYVQNSDGTIKKFGDTQVARDGIQWKNPIAKAKFIDHYEFIDGEQEKKDISIRLQTNALYLSMIPEEKTEIKSVLYQIPEYISDDLNLLSLLGRKRIVCIESNVRILRNESMIWAFARYKTWGGFYNLPSNQGFLRTLISPILLRKGVFSKMFDIYRVSPYKKIIDRTTPYLLSSYEDGYVETHLVNAYAALESMVDGMGSFHNINYLLGNNQFKKLSQKIESLIFQEIGNKDIADGITLKLPELRRRNFLNQLLFLIDFYKVNTSLIFPPDTDQSLEFHKILKRRNILIHSGTINHSDQCLLDLNRIQKLTELWILKLLDCPDEVVNKQSLYLDAPINKLII